MRSQDFAYGAPPSATGLDDNFRPSMDSCEVAEQPQQSSTSQISTSYDELRRQNREDFQQKRQEDRPRVAVPIPSAKPYPPSPHVVKNSYGDVWEE